MIEIITTTEPLKFAPNWGADGFQILDKNKDIREYGKIMPGCEHSGCVVYMFVIGNRDEYFANYKHIERATERIQKAVENQEKCGDKFETMREVI
jgi:hypothetical protein